MPYRPVSHRSGRVRIRRKLAAASPARKDGLIPSGAMPIPGPSGGAGVSGAVGRVGVGVRYQCLSEGPQLPLPPTGATVSGKGAASGAASGSTRLAARIRSTPPVRRLRSPGRVGDRLCVRRVTCCPKASRSAPAPARRACIPERMLWVPVTFRPPGARPTMTMAMVSWPGLMGSLRLAGVA